MTAALLCLLLVRTAPLVCAVGTIAGACLTAWIATQADADLRADVVTALDRAGWEGKHHVAAHTIGRSPRRLSLQTNGHEPLSSLCLALTRLGDFEREFLKVRAARLGAVVIETSELKALLLEVQALVRKPMARMDGPRRKQVSA